MKADILTYILAYILVGICIIAMLLVPVEMAQEFIRERREYRAAKKDISLNIRVWTSIAKSCETLRSSS